MMRIQQVVTEAGLSGISGFVYPHSIIKFIFNFILSFQCTKSAEPDKPDGGIYNI